MMSSFDVLKIEVQGAGFLSWLGTTTEGLEKKNRQKSGFRVKKVERKANIVTGS